MENKDRLNLNPEVEENNAQEENAASISDAINVQQTNLPEENQENLLKNEVVEDVKEVEADIAEAIPEAPAAIGIYHR